MTSGSVRSSAKIALVLSALSSFAGRARAEANETAPFDLDISYSAPPPCPDQREFEEAIRRRTLGVSPPDGSASIPKKLDVRLRTTATGARGHLVIVDRSGVASMRDIEAATCAEATDGLALVVSLLFDPAAERSAPRVDAPPPKPIEATPRRREPRRHPQLALATSFIAASGQSPRVAPGGELSGALELEGAGSFRFLARVGARLTLPTTVTSDEGTATFKWWAAFAALCPGLASPGELVMGAVCATVEQGVLTAAGTDTRNPRTSGTSWTAVGPGVALAWAVLPPLHLLATADGIFPLGRDRFVLGNEEIHEVPSFAVRAGIGLGVRIW